MRSWSLGSLLTVILIIGSSGFAAPMPISKSPKRQSLGKSLPEGEKAIYLRLVDAYRRGHIEDTYKFKNLMMKHYAQSVHADNAIYLTGLLDYQRGRMAEAVSNFGEIIVKFPKSNKRPAAMYAKSQAYSKLNLPELSKKLLEQIKSEYPGSPESQRAVIDLRIKERKG